MPSILPFHWCIPLSRMKLNFLYTLARLVLGQDVLYTDGEGSRERVVYEGATSDGQWHTLQQSDTSKLATPGSHLHFQSNQTLQTSLRHHLITAVRWVLASPKKMLTALPTQELLAHPNKNS